MWLLPRSSNCAQASECSEKESQQASGTSEELPALWVTSSGTPTLRPSSWRGWQARRWSRHLYGPETLRLSDGSDGLAQWIASWLDSRASRTAWPEAAKEPTTPAGFGRQSQTAFAWFDPASSCWKTSPDCDLLGEWLPYSQIWPRSGSVSNGIASERPTWARPTSGSGCSSWQSPQTSDCNGARQPDGKRSLGLNTQTGAWATPRANDSEKRGTVAERSTPELVSMTQHWPTPSAAVTNLTESPESWQARADGLKEKHGNGNGAGMPLTVAASAWPTPASRDQKGENSIEHMTNGGGRIMHIDRLPNFVMYHFSHRDQTMTDGPQSLQQDPTSPLRLRLNPQFVDWLMGWLPGMTSTEPTACDAEAMASFRSRLGSHLSYLLGEPGLHRAAA